MAEQVTLQERAQRPQDSQEAPAAEDRVAEEAVPVTGEPQREDSATLAEMVPGLETLLVAEVAGQAQREPTRARTLEETEAQV